jgi:polysaccharide biosynthesis/export protein
LRIQRSQAVGVLAVLLAGVGIGPAIRAADPAASDKVTSIEAFPGNAVSDLKSGGEQEKGKPQSTTVPSSKPADAEKSPDSYSIGIGDELQISVWREPELSMPVQVRPDGMITLPLINDLSVVGLTTHQLQELLTEKFKPFVNEPQVTVIVRSIHSRKVYLLGQVLKPGPYALNEKKTVLELITEAGGPSQFAKTGSIYIMRTVDGKQIRLKFNYKKALAGKPDSGDTELLPGDKVVVP